MSTPTILLQPTYVTFSNTVQYKPTVINGGMFAINPQVVYNNVVYQYVTQGTAVSPATNPVTYKTPNTDTSAIALYTLGAGSSAEVLSTVLTGLSVASGTPSASSTILQAIGYLTYRSYLLLTGLTVASVANGALSLATVAATSKSTDITVGATSVALPLNKTFSRGQIKLIVTTAATSGATFAVTGTNCTVVSESIAVGASLTDAEFLINFTVVTTGTASPSISLVASSTTGTVAINNTSSFSLS